MKDRIMRPERDEELAKWWKMSVLDPPTKETAALAVEECVTLDRNPSSDRSAMLRRISLTIG